MELRPVKKQVTDKIRKLRVEKGLSQDNVAFELGLSHSSYSKIERGETDPNLSRLFQLAKILGVGIIDFFTEDNKPNLKETVTGYGNINNTDLEKLNQSIPKLLSEINKLRTALSEKEISSKYKRTKKG